MFYYYVFVCILPGKAVPEMTYTVSGETLHPTYSLTHSLWRVTHNIISCKQKPKRLQFDIMLFASRICLSSNVGVECEVSICNSVLYFHFLIYNHKIGTLWSIQILVFFLESFSVIFNQKIQIVKDSTFVRCIAICFHHVGLFSGRKKLHFKAANPRTAEINLLNANKSFAVSQLDLLISTFNIHVDSL